MAPTVRHYKAEKDTVRIQLKSGTGSSSSTFDNDQKGALSRVKDAVIPIRVQDLKILNQCLTRCCDQQKRLLGSLTYFQRQFEDERKITEDAQTCIDRMVATSMSLQGCGDFV